MFNEVKNFSFFKKLARSYKTGTISEKLIRRMTNTIISCADLIDLLYVRYNFRKRSANNADKIFSYTTKRELNALFKLAASCPKGSVVLEIGSHLGASTCYLAAGLTRASGKLICVDTWQNETMPEGELDTFNTFKKNTIAYSDLITMIRKRSDKLEASDLPSSLQLVFIDGDHSYNSVKTDLQKVAGYIPLKGVIAFHDIRAFKGVSKVVGEALAEGSWHLTGNVDNLIWLTKVDKEADEFLL